MIPASAASSLAESQSRAGSVSLVLPSLLIEDDTILDAEQYGDLVAISPAALAVGSENVNDLAILEFVFPCPIGNRYACFEEVLSDLFTATQFHGGHFCLLLRWKTSGKNGTRMRAMSTESKQTESFGARIRAERLSLGFSQAAFAKELGIHRNTQGNYESSEREPDAAYLAAASKAGVDIGYVLRGERASLTHQSLLHLVGVIFDALLLTTPSKKEFDQVCQLAYEEHLAMWRGEGIGEKADRAAEAIIKKSPLFLEESVLTDVVERLEFVLESKAIKLTPAAKARSILHLYLATKARDKPLDLQTVADVINENC